MTFILFLIVSISFMLIRNTVAYQNRVKILNAIYAYNLNHISTISYGEMEPYEFTLFRIWDFGCTRIVPLETFKMIQPYLH